MNGKLLVNNKVNIFPDGTAKININSLKKGLYDFEVKTHNTTFSEKIMENR